jgi:DNA-binding beta-propeller fold protein YncE
MKRISAFVLAVCALAASARASSTGYVYVLEPMTGCNTCEPQLLVFDGETTRLVTRIPLQSGKTPAGVAISPDGAHIYVSNFQGAFSTLTVIDARQHVKLATYSVGGVAGHLAVAEDDSAVFVRSGTLLARFDTTTHTITTLATVGNGGGVAFNNATDTVLVPVYGDGSAGAVTAHDPLTLVEVQRRTLATGAAALSVSPTFANVYVVRERTAAGLPVSLTTLDASTLAIVRDLEIGSNGGGVSPAYSPTRSAAYVGGRSLFEISDSGTVVTIPLQTSSSATAVALPPLQKYLFFTSATLDATGLTAVAAMDLDTRQIVSTYPFTQPPGFDMIRSTPLNVPSCTYRLDSAYASFAQSPSDVSIRLTTGCAWSASSDDTWVRVSSTFGTGSATLTLSADPNPSSENRRSTVIIGGQVVTVTQAGSSAAPAFGFIDTPADGASGLSGAIAVTGWALDDVGVKAVHLYRDPVAGEPQTLIPLGDATLVEGARPDVQAIFPSLPFASRAGWGYQLLTNVLPGGGNGTFRLHVFVEDLDGHSTLLGTRTITVNNTAAAEPFGAIDTPGQGETVSGVITNWGWALTPQPANIPTDGSTIDVLIDGVVVGHPTYGLDRADIAALFPGYANTNSAVGYFTIDTTTLTNGVHTLAWVVRDSLGRAQGIGSRYFTVINP